MIERTAQLVNNNFVGPPLTGADELPRPVLSCSEADHDPNAALVAVGSMTNDATAAPMATVMNSIAIAW